MIASLVVAVSRIGTVRLPKMISASETYLLSPQYIVPLYTERVRFRLLGIFMRGVVGTLSCLSGNIGAGLAALRLVPALEWPFMLSETAKV